MESLKISRYNQNVNRTNRMSVDDKSINADSEEDGRRPNDMPIFSNSSTPIDRHLLNDELLNTKLLIEFKFLFDSNDLDLELSASSVYLTISSELIKLNESLFHNYDLDQSSLSVREVYPEDQLDRTIHNLLRLVLNNSTSIVNARRLKRLQLIKLNRLNRTSQLDEFDYLPIDNQTKPADKSRVRCEESKLSFCSFLPYSSIMYPNLVNHHSLQELESEFIYFRQIIDSECFYLAKEFICLIAQPACPTTTTTTTTATNLPCGQLCEQFLSACTSTLNFGFLPAHIRDNLINSCQQLTKLQEPDGESLYNRRFKNKTVAQMTEQQTAKGIDKFSKVNNLRTNEDEKTIENGNLIVRTNGMLTSDALNKLARKAGESGSNNGGRSINNESLANSIAESTSGLRTEPTNESPNELGDDLTTVLSTSWTLDEMQSALRHKLNANRDDVLTPARTTNSTSGNNQQLSNNCFNLDDLEQLSVRTLN